MAEGRVAEIVRERQRLGEIFVEPERPSQGTGDLRHLDVWVRRVRKWSPSWNTKTCVLCFRRRKAVAWMIRSRSRWNSLRVGEPGSFTSLPRLRDGSAA